MHFVYILKSLAKTRYYIGSTENPERRLLEHNAGQAISTKPYRPWIVVFSQKFPSKAIARAVEAGLKRKKSKIILEQIIDDGFIRNLGQ